MRRLHHLRMLLIGLGVAFSAVLTRRNPGFANASPALIALGLAAFILLCRRRSEFLWIGLLIFLCGLTMLRVGPVEEIEGCGFAGKSVVEGRVTLDSCSALGAENIYLKVISDSSGIFKSGERIGVDLQESQGLFGWEDHLVLSGDVFRFSKGSKKCTGLMRVTCLNHRETSGNPLIKTVNHLRSSFFSFCSEYVGGRRRGMLLGAMLMGNVNLLDGDTRVSLRRAGLSHICAASGLHVAILAGLAFSLFNKLRFSRKAISIPILILITTYALMVGGRSPVLRASLLVPLSLGAWVTASRYHPLSALGLTLTVLVILSPQLTGDISFRLTFLAAGGIIVLAGPIKDALTPRGGGISGMLACTLAAQLAILPLAAHEFGEISLVATLSNIIVLPVLPLAMATGMAGGLSNALGLPFSRVLGFFAGALAELILRIGIFFSRPAWATITVGKVPISFTIIYGLVLLCVLRKGATRRSRRVFLVAVMAVALLAGCGKAAGAGGGDRAVILDVGQGDSILLQSEGGVNVLLDGGERESVLRRKLNGYGVRFLDLLILSHPDRDHVGGLDAALQECSVGAVLETGLHGGSSYAEWLKAVQEEGSAMISAHAGLCLELGDVSVEVLAPTEADREHFDRNSASLVCRISTGKMSILATGDVEEAEELALIFSGENLQANILKVPHHGGYSGCSREFFAKVKMALAVISVGRDNRYGHPHPNTLQALREAGCLIFRTDRDGDIIIRGDSRGMLSVLTEKRE